MNDFPYLLDIEQMRKTRTTSRALCEESRAARERSRAVIQGIEKTIARCRATLEENDALGQVPV
jgi:hypothetical protein